MSTRAANASSLNKLRRKDPISGDVDALGRSAQTSQQSLADYLQSEIEQASLSLDQLSDRTKIPRSTIRALLGDEGSALLPERVYLRGHLNVLLNEMQVADGELGLRLFDLEYDQPIEPETLEAAPTYGVGTMAVGAGLGCVALLAVIVAFVS
jgi:hypothetical protein